MEAYEIFVGKFSQGRCIENKFEIPPDFCRKVKDFQKGTCDKWFQVSLRQAFRKQDKIELQKEPVDLNK